jgi:glycosyltransferase involved in cell wall biosynthesis
LPRLSVVVPVYNEEAVLPELRCHLVDALAEVSGGYELVFVDDGSADGSAAIIEGWAVEDPRVVFVQLSRNFGMDLAMSAGMDHASGDFVALMHADLQDPPELLPQMLAKAEAGADVVYARRIGRDESVIKRFLATAFYEMMARTARVPYQGQAGDFRVMSRRVVDLVRAMPERRRFLRGMVAWVGFDQVPVEYRRASRTQGRGASYPQLFRLAVEALTAFSDVPLALASWFGTAVSLLSGTLAAVLLVLALTGTVTASLGVWILIAVLFLGGVQLMSIGIVGRYLANVHEQVLGRPIYLVARAVNAPAVDPAERRSLSRSAGRSTT